MKNQSLNSPSPLFCQTEDLILSSLYKGRRGGILEIQFITRNIYETNSAKAGESLIESSGSNLF